MRCASLASVAATISMRRLCCINRVEDRRDGEESVQRSRSDDGLHVSGLAGDNRLSPRRSSPVNVVSLYAH